MDRLAELAANRNTEAAVRLEQNAELQKKLKWTEEKLAEKSTALETAKAELAAKQKELSNVYADLEKATDVKDNSN